MGNIVFGKPGWIQLKVYFLFCLFFLILCHHFYHVHYKNLTGAGGGSWMAQSVKRPSLAQVMISRLVGSGSVLTARSLELALNFVSLPCSALPLLMLFSLPLSLSKDK